MSKFFPKNIFGRIVKGLKGYRVEPVGLSQYLIMKLYVYGEFLDIDEVDAHVLTDVVVESAVQVLKEIRESEESVKEVYYTPYSFSDDNLTEEEEWIVKKMMLILMLDWGVHLDYIDYNMVRVSLFKLASWRTK